MKLPAMQFYPADWRKDPGVQALTYFERGVWFEILCIMHESEKRGYLMLAGNAMDDDTIARVLRISLDEWVRVKESILRFGVGSVDDSTSALFCRRMVRDTKSLFEWKRKSSKAGKLSAKSPKHNNSRGLDGKFAPNQNRTAPTEPKPNSSSSSSSSSSNNKIRSKDFLSSLKEDPIYSHIDFDYQIGLMQRWLARPENKGRRLTERFVVNWINKIDRPVKPTNGSGRLFSNTKITTPEEIERMLHS